MSDIVYLRELNDNDGNVFYPVTDVHGLVSNGELAFEDKPTKGSEGIASSGGIFDAINTNGSAFDVSSYMSGATYSTLSAAIAAIPQDYRTGGMSMKYILTSNGKYAQYIYKSNSIQQADFENPANWYASVALVDDSQSGTIPDFDAESQSLHITEQVLSNEQKAQTLSNVGISGIDNNPTKNSDHLVKSGGVYTAITSSIGEFDLTAYMSGTTYASLTAALTAMGGVPSEYKKGGMTLKYVQTSDNKYVQYRLMSDNWSTTESDWQGVDDEPTMGSKNLVKSGGVEGYAIAKVQDAKVFYVTDSNGNIIVKIDKDGVHSVDFKVGQEDVSIISNIEQIRKIDILWGKKLVCCGDSITEGVDMDAAGIIQSSSIKMYQSNANGDFSQITSNFKKTYGYQIAERHNMTFYNAGVSGSTMQGIQTKNGFSLANGRYTKLPSDADIITIFFGWNDTAYGILGTIDDDTNDSYYGGYNVVLPYLIEHHPYAKIILIVPFGCTDGHRNAIRLLANKWGVTCFDMYQGGTPLYYGKEDYVDIDLDIVTVNRAKYQANGAHPNYEGHKALGDMLEQFLLSGVVYPKRTNIITENSKEIPTSGAVFNKVKQEEERAKSVEATKLSVVLDDDAFYFTDSNNHIIAKIDANGIHSVNIDEFPNVINGDNILITDNNGYIIAKIDANGIHSAQSKHSVACMVLSENYYPITSPIRNSEGNVTHANVMFATGVTGKINITYTLGLSSNVEVIYGDYTYTIIINRDSDGNVTTVSVD